MSFRRKMVGALLVGAVTAALSVIGAGAAHAAEPRNNCVFETPRGYYLTAVGGGARTTDVIHTDATRIGAWEKFDLIPVPGTSTIYVIRTDTGHLLTAVNSGGLTTAVKPDVLHSNASSPLAWERFTIQSLGSNVVTIQSSDGHYLTALDGGNRTKGALNSNATQVGTLERFRMTCNS